MLGFHPQWPDYCPSSSRSHRTDPKIWESDTTLTAYLPPSSCRIVQRNRCPPNHPVVGMTSGISDKWQHWSNVTHPPRPLLMVVGTNSLNPLKCKTPWWWPTSQRRRLWPWRMSLRIRKVLHQWKVCTLKLPTSMLSWLHATVARECYDDFWSNTQTNPICITIAQPT